MMFQILRPLFSISILILLIVATYTGYQHQKQVIINTHLEMEKQIIKQTTRSATIWFEKRFKEGVPIAQIEQEILKQFVEPIRLLENGDAWIYHKDHVIFDQSSDFPEIYRGKSMREIFQLQKKSGAAHYEELIKGVETGTSGTTYYIWLPEKGAEWAAWQSFQFGKNTWTIGLSTPEQEIFNHYNLSGYLLKSIIYNGIIFLLLVVVIIFSIRRKRLEDLHREKLEYFASIDSLTGVFNRHSGELLLEKQMNQMRRMSAHLTITFIDINNLKVVNDTMGHQAGDQLIKDVCKVLQNNIRSSDMICRLGGDEFLVIFPNCALEGGKNRWEKIDQRIDVINRSGHYPYKISFSYGLEEYGPGDLRSSQELIQAADQKMYTHKQKQKKSRK